MLCPECGELAQVVKGYFRLHATSSGSWCPLSNEPTPVHAEVMDRSSSDRVVARRRAGKPHVHGRELIRRVAKPWVWSW